TLTSNGVQNTLTYWVGKNGYGPYLKNQTWKS
ncbi:MAG: Na(+)-translocating NADH-quinone reductase subunit C, partial [Paraglaciecola sp.]